MSLTDTRLLRERRTMEAMIGIYCRHHHAGSAPCSECQGLLDYATLRLERCRFQGNKSTCVRCPVHCYREDKRLLVRRVMIFAGPRMLLQHPLLAIRHLLDGLKPVPPCR